VLTHLLDTDICVYAMKARDFRLLKKLESLIDNTAVSDVTLFELYYGAQKYADPDRRLAIVNDFASQVVILPFDTQAANYAGPLRSNLEKQGLKIGVYDLLIAGIALAHNLILMTNNVREFNRVPGLRVESFQRQP
jgi:tRNA(fMet)-specific endonuclease VapC